MTTVRSWLGWGFPEALQRHPKARASVSICPRAAPLHTASSHSLISKVASKSTYARASSRPETGTASVLLQFSGSSHQPGPAGVSWDYTKMQRQETCFTGISKMSCHRGMLWKCGEVHGERPVVDELADLTENLGPAPEPGRTIT